MPQAPDAHPAVPVAPVGRPLSIGLTGGIGSGKSTVAAMLVRLGAGLVDTDAIAHRLSAPGGEAIPALRSAFGDEAITAEGALDRAHVRQRVFADPAAKARLEGILHPMIGQVTQREAEALVRSGCPALVFDVPLLTESSAWRARCDRILIVDCEQPTQVQRVIARSGWPQDQVLRVIAQQASRPARRAIADAVVYNDGLSPEALARVVEALWQAWGLPAAHPA